MQAMEGIHIFYDLQASSYIKAKDILLGATLPHTVTHIEGNTK